MLKTVKEIQTQIAEITAHKKTVESERDTVLTSLNQQAVAIQNQINQVFVKSLELASIDEGKLELLEKLLIQAQEETPVPVEMNRASRRAVKQVNGKHEA